MISHAIWILVQMVGRYRIHILIDSIYQYIYIIFLYHITNIIKHRRTHLFVLTMKYIKTITGTCWSVYAVSHTSANNKNKAKNLIKSLTSSSQIMLQFLLLFHCQNFDWFCNYALKLAMNSMYFLQYFSKKWQYVPLLYIIPLLFSMLLNASNT